VAFNAAPAARAAATHVVDSGDLRAILPLLEQVVAAPRGS
jgi:hypothetical protein